MFGALSLRQRDVQNMRQRAAIRFLLLLILCGIIW